MVRLRMMLDKNGFESITRRSPPWCVRGWTVTYRRRSGGDNSRVAEFQSYLDRAVRTGDVGEHPGSAVCSRVRLYRNDREAASLPLRALGSRPMIRLRGRLRSTTIGPVSVVSAEPWWPAA